MSDPPIEPAESTQNTKLPWLNPINYAASLITIFGAIAGAIVAVSAVVALFWYSYLQPKLNDMVITTIADDLKKPDSIILNQVVSAIKLDLNSKNGDLIAPIIHIYESKIAQRFDKMFGEMTLGLLILTKKDPQGYIHLFDPPTRFGTIYLKIENLLEGDDVSLQCPNGPPRKLNGAAEFKVYISSNGCVDAKGTSPVENNASGVEDPALGKPIEPATAYFRDLYTVTVKLIHAERFKSDPNVRVRYMAIVYPPLDADVLK
jgi:hypothetical protein